MKEFTVDICGVDHTMQAASEDELRARGYYVKSVRPQNKALKPTNKGASGDESHPAAPDRKP